jgi:radical SAM superfamily enzyme YgiQ (UPF0313 family)
MLAQAGAEVKIADLALDNTPITSIVQDFEPTMIGFSFLSTSWPTVAQHVTDIRAVFDGYLIAGGIHATLFPQQVLDSGFDVVVCGEGEQVVANVMSILWKRGKSTELAALPGVALLQEDTFICNPNTTSVMCLDTLPFINRELYDLSLYHHHSIMTSRGCPYSCKFCCNWGVGVRKCRSRSPANVVQEVKHLVDQYGADLIYFADDLFFFSDKKRSEFCELLLESRIEVDWVVQLRADSVNQDMLNQMKRAGCVKVCYGIESGDQAVLDAVGKRITVEQIRHAINESHKSGLHTKTWWVLGLPGSFEQQLASLDLMLELMPNEISIHSLVPLPGSEYWQHAERYGLHILDRDAFGDLYYHSIPDNIRMEYLTHDELRYLFEYFIQQLKQAGYRTTDEAGECDKLLLSTPYESQGFSV